MDDQSAYELDRVERKLRGEIDSLEGRCQRLERELAKLRQVVRDLAKAVVYLDDVRAIS